MENKKNHRPSQDQKSPHILCDYNMSGKTKDYAKKKNINEAFAEVFHQTPGLEKYGDQLLNCGSYRQMVSCCNEKHGKITIGANFCKNRICVECNLRRSLRTQNEVLYLATKYLELHPTHQPLFLTLTTLNCSYEKLGKIIDELNAALSKITKRKAYKNAIRAHFKAMEITRNPDRNDFHPHFHIILMVPPNYFYKDDDLYITHDQWLKMWQQVLKNNEVTQIDIRGMNLKGKKGKKALEAMIAEVAKYITKPLDFIKKDENGKLKADPESVIALFLGTKGRRLLSFGGEFNVLKKEKKRLHNLEKAKRLEEKARDAIDENGNPKEPTPKKYFCKYCDQEMFREDYQWNHTLKNYVLIYTERPDTPEYENYEHGVDKTQCRAPPDLPY